MILFLAVLSMHVPSVTESVNKRYEELWQIEVQGSPYLDRSDFSTKSYRRFDSLVYLPDKDSHLTYQGPSQLVSTLHLFRIGAAGLRASYHSDDPEDRQCPHCRGGVIEDEKHVIQHCPLYSNPRLDPEFAPLFRTLLTDGSLCAFFNDTDQHLLARFLHGCLHIHSELLQGLPT